MDHGLENRGGKLDSLLSLVLLYASKIAVVSNRAEFDQHGIAGTECFLNVRPRRANKADTA